MSDLFDLSRRRAAEEQEVMDKILFTWIGIFEVLIISTLVITHIF